MLQCDGCSANTFLSMCSATQELRGLGLANLVGAAFNCYTTTGSFSRSAIMHDVGAKTQLAGIISGAPSWDITSLSPVVRALQVSAVSQCCPGMCQLFRRCQKKAFTSMSWQCLPYTNLAWQPSTMDTHPYQAN